MLPLRDVREAAPAEMGYVLSWIAGFLDISQSTVVSHDTPSVSAVTGKGEAVISQEGGWMDGDGMVGGPRDFPDFFSASHSTET